MTRLETQGLSYLRSIEAYFDGVPVESVIRFGDPIRKIVVEADVFGADLTAMTSGVGWLKGALTGGGIVDKLLREKGMPSSPIASCTEGLRERKGESIEVAGTQRGGRLSGGEQQMLACGRALVGNPRILVMDEPSEGLAPLLVRELARILHELKARGTSILLAEQNLAFALRIADYVYVLSKGAIMFESPPQELRGNEEAKARWRGMS